MNNQFDDINEVLSSMNVLLDFQNKFDGEDKIIFLKAMKKLAEQVGYDWMVKHINESLGILK